MICKKCGNEIPDKSVFCLVCGEKVEVIQMPAPADVMPAKSKFCGQCGAMIVPGCKFCISCGAKAIDISEAMAAEPEPEKEPEKEPEIIEPECVDEQEAAETYAEEEPECEDEAEVIEDEADYAEDESGFVDTYDEDSVDPFMLVPMFCTGCGERLTAGNRFCAYCGTPAAEPAVADEADYEAEEIYEEGDDAYEEAEAYEDGEAYEDAETYEDGEAVYDDEYYEEDYSEGYEDGDAEHIEDAEAYEEYEETEEYEEQTAAIVPVEEAPVAKQMTRPEYGEDSPYNRTYSYPKKKGFKAGFVRVFRKIPAKLWGMALAIILAIVTIVSIFSCANNVKVEPDRYVIAKSKDLVYFMGNGYFASLGGDKLSVGDAGIAMRGFSYDHSVAAVLDIDNNLWVVTKDSSERVSSNVRRCNVSVNGDYVIFDKYYGDSLFVYNVKEDETLTISEDCTMGDWVISPDGKAVVYKDEDECYLYREGKKTQSKLSFCSGDSEIVAVSDGGKHIYHVTKGKFYCDDVLLLKDYPLDCIFNVDGSEMLFFGQGTTFYYKAGSDDTVKIAEGRCLNVLAPYGTMNVTLSHSMAHFIGVYSLNEQVVDIAGSLYYISAFGEEVDKIVRDYGDSVISADGKSVVYSKGGSIYKVKDVTKDEDHEQLASDVGDGRISLFASNDLKSIYYVVDYSKLYCLDGKKSNLISDKLIEHGASVYCVYSEKLGRVVYADGTGHICTAGTTKKTVKQVWESDGRNFDIMCVDGEPYVFAFGKNDGIILELVSHSKYNEIVKVKY